MLGMRKMFYLARILALLITCGQITIRQQEVCVKNAAWQPAQPSRDSEKEGEGFSTSYVLHDSDGDFSYVNEKFIPIMEKKTEV